MADPIPSTPQSAPPPGAVDPDRGVRFAYDMPPAALTVLQKTEAKYGLPESTLYGIQGVETGGLPSPKKALNYVNKKSGAYGPFQLLPAALTDIGENPKAFRGKPYGYQADVAARYAKLVLERTASLTDLDPSIRIAAGYNTGAQGVLDAIASGKYPATPEGLNQLSTDNGNPDYVMRFNKYRGMPLVVGATTMTEPTGVTAPGQATAAAPGSAPPQMTTSDKMSWFDAPNTQQIQAAAGGTSSPDTPMSAALKAFPDAAQSVAKAGYENIIKPAASLMTQFPAEVDQNIAAGIQHVGKYIDETTGGLTAFTNPGEGPIPFTPIDPMGAINFATTPINPTGRLANAGINFGVGVLNAADGAAQKQAADMGLDWKGMGSMSRLGMIADNFNYTTMADNLPWILGGTAAGAILAPGGAYQKKVSDAKKLVDERYAKQLGDVTTHNAERVRLAEAATRNKEARVVNLNEREQAVATLYNQEREETRSIQLAGQASYDRQLAEVEPRLKHAEDITGRKRLPPDTWDIKREGENKVALGMLLNEVGVVSDVNPGSTIYQKRWGTWDTLTEEGGRELDPEDLAPLDNFLKKVAEETKSSDRMDVPELRDALKPLYDPENKMAEVESLTVQAREWRNSGDSGKAADLEAKADKIILDIKPVRVKDVTDRAATIDNVRRGRAFKESTITNHRDRQILGELSSALRSDPDPNNMAKTGLVHQALKNADDSRAWTEGNAASRIWWNKRRAANDLMKDFGDIRPGARTVRNRLKASERSYKNTYGVENYNRLYELAEGLDDLQARIPPAPRVKGYAEKKVVPRIPPAPILPKGIQPIPKPPTDTAWQDELKTSAAGKFLHGLNELYDPRALARMMTGAVLGGAGVGSAMVGHLPSATHAAVGGVLLGVLLTVPAASKAFSQAVKYLDHPTSREFLEAYSKLIVIGSLHQKYGGEIAAPPPPKLQGPPAPITSVLPPSSRPALPSRATRGPVPAPSPRPSPPGMPRIQGML